MIRQLLFLVALFISYSGLCQKFETEKGSLENLSTIDQYKIVFEYPDNIEIHNFDSEADFLKAQVAKREKKESGSGEEFKKLWFENRANRYEPTFIQEFNGFMLEDRHVTVSKHYQEAEYTMAVKIHYIHPGNDIVLWQQKAELEVSFEIYKSENPEHILYASKPLPISGVAVGDEFEKITTVYGLLGRWSAKFFCRKT
ncbi:hypothetical protein JQC67_05220 [Aurantibacter crassamenti]|uniref:hypothetical protein n=1 Tax=Aurantibacter crassamenti TaxID=1837375 RepID=UPI00193AB1AC|nr:hypothetical protein [Aurantibacter crassamenti]MBM1105538.1 hypothetical protein [Aurantibacter crassamenti]